MISRRDFLRAIALGGGIIAGELWIPGARKIFLPPDKPLRLAAGGLAPFTPVMYHEALQMFALGGFYDCRRAEVVLVDEMPHQNDTLKQKYKEIQSVSSRMDWRMGDVTKLDLQDTSFQPFRDVDPKAVVIRAGGKNMGFLPLANCPVRNNNILTIQWSHVFTIA